MPSQPFVHPIDDVLTCPIDGLPLTARDGGAGCPSGHMFDRAREGYLNLLPVQHKASRDPGDTKDMIAARRRVLDAGHFAPLYARIQALVAAAAAGQGERPLILDAGCGEGSLVGALLVGGEGRRIAGADISKWAVQAAAKRHKSALFVVASNRQLPFARGSAAVVTSLFGFPVWTEFARVLRPGGRLVIADPGSDHLMEMRAIIYREVVRGEPPGLEGAIAAGFRLAGEEKVRFAIALSSRIEIAALLSMTPHDHRASAEGRAALAALDALALTGDVVVRTLEKA